MTVSSATRSNLIGIGSLCLGVFIFSIQDAILKGLSGEHAVTLAIVIRSLVGLPILLVMVHFECGLKRLASSNYPLTPLARAHPARVLHHLLSRFSRLAAGRSHCAVLHLADLRDRAGRGFPP